MTNKFKLLLAVMAIIAGVSMHRFYNVFSLATISGPAPTPRTHQNPPSSANDADGDGLSNEDESSWGTNWQNPDTDGDGYKDGEEVASGHNPRKPGPDDFLDTSKNLTQKASYLSAGGLLAGDLDPKNENFDKSIDILSETLILDFLDTQPDPQSSKIATGPDTKEDQEKYLNFVASIMQATLLDFSLAQDSSKNILEQPIYLLARSSQARKAYDSLITVSPPKSWKSVHIKILDILKKLEANYTYMANFREDPLRATLATTYLANNIRPEARGLIKNIATGISKNKLILSGDFYEILRLLFK